MKKANQNTGAKKGLSKIITTIISLIIVAIASLIGFGGETGEEQGYSEPTPIVSEEAYDDMEDSESIEEISDVAEALSESKESEEESVDSEEEESVSEEASYEEPISEEAISEEPVVEEVTVAEITFRNEYLLEQHYDKHGIEMGFDSAEEYELAAYRVIINPNALHKIEAEDGDDVYYVEETNEFVVVSQDGYIRTYFNPNAGIDYYNRQ